MENIQCLEGNIINANLRVIDGFGTLDLIEQVEVNKKNKPLNPIKITKVQIHANPIAT